MADKHGIKHRIKTRAAKDNQVRYQTKRLRPRPVLYGILSMLDVVELGRRLEKYRNAA